MRAVFALVLLVGVALAGFAVYMAQNYVGQSEQRLIAAQEMSRKTGKLVEVYALRTPVGYGDPILQDNTHKIWLQEKFLPKGAYTDQAVLFPPGVDLPRHAMRPIEANEVLLASRLSEPGQPAGLTGKLTEGKRAFQIRVTTSSGVAGFVMPEDHIDIYWTGNGGNGEVTRLIERSILIIAVDHSKDQAERGEGTASTVTVAVTAAQVARLQQAQATGVLAMAIVAPGAELDEAETIQVNRDGILGVTQEPPQERAPAPEVCVIRTRKGADVIETQVPCTN